MATRFRKHRTRKMKGRKGLKTRRHRGGDFGLHNIKRMGSELAGSVKGAVKTLGVKAGVMKSNANQMFEQETKALEDMKKNKEKEEARKRALEMYKKK